MSKDQIVSMMESISLPKKDISYPINISSKLSSTTVSAKGRRPTLVATPIPGAGGWTSLALGVSRYSRPILHSKYFDRKAPFCLQ